ncbi:MAG: S8 family serine peptidase, partial [Bacillota bacterium]
MNNSQKQKCLFLILFTILALLISGCSDPIDDSTPEENVVESINVLVKEPGANYNQEKEEWSSYSSIPKSWVILNDKEVSTNDDGLATLYNLREGEHQLIVKKEGYESKTKNLNIEKAKSDISISMLQENSSVIEPDTVEYNVKDPQDVKTEISWNDSTELKGIYRKISEGNYEVHENEDKDETESFSQNFEINSENTLIIKKEYIEKYTDNLNPMELFLKFDQGSDALLTINIIEEEIKTDAEIDPVEFDFYLNNPEDLVADITWNEATEITKIEIEIDDENFQLKQDFPSTNNSDTLTIDSSSILDEEPVAGETIKIVVSFDKGEPVLLKVNILEEDSSDPEDPEPEPGDITISGNLNINHNFPGSVVESEEFSTSSAKLWETSTPQAQNTEQEMIVRFQSGTNKSEMEQKIKNNGYIPLEFLEELNAALVKIPEEKITSQAKNILAQDPSVLSATDNKILSIFDYTTPNDEYYDKQWAPSVIRLPQTWRDAEGSSRIRMAVIDTGINYNHFELSDFIDLDSGYNFVDDTDDPFDGHGHGTHVAGIIGAKANNEKGVVGVMWDSELLPVKVLDDSGSGSEWSVSQGILYAAGLLEDKPIKKADVINMSLGMHSSEVPELIEDAVQKATDAGVVIVAASGNNGENDVGYPARFEEVIAVGALSYNESGAPELADYSSYGKE